VPPAFRPDDDLPYAVKGLDVAVDRRHADGSTPGTGSRDVEERVVLVRRRSPLALLLPPGALALWFGALTVGEQLLGWTA
jgi:hypothetical protein